MLTRAERTRNFRSRQRFILAGILAAFLSALFGLCGGAGAFAFWLPPVVLLTLMPSIIIVGMLNGLVASYIQLENHPDLSLFLLMLGTGIGWILAAALSAFLFSHLQYPPTPVLIVLEIILHICLGVLIGLIPSSLAALVLWIRKKWIV